MKKGHLEHALQTLNAMAVKNSEEGQKLVHEALFAGEKALLSTPSTGREVINHDIHDVQSKWDRYLIRLQEMTSSYEQALIRHTNHEMNLSKLLSWLTEHERKLNDITNAREMTPSNLGLVPAEQALTKARIKKLEGLLQEVVSHEDVVNSVDRNLLTPENDDIKSRYEDLLTRINKHLAENKKKMEALEDFNKSCDDFEAWLNGAKEKVASSSVLNDDRDVVAQKCLLLKSLLSEDEGMEKLRATARCCEMAKPGLMESEKTQMDNRVGRLQNEYELFKEIIEDSKAGLEVAATKWNEYEDQYAKCESFLDSMEPKLSGFKQLSPDISKKKSNLEEFQVNELQMIFEAQTEFNRLNLKAQLLLESYSNHSISSAVANLCSRYNSLVSNGRDTLHALEQRYQEHQQLQCLITELTELMESSKEKYENLSQGLKSRHLDELNSRLNSLKSLIGNAEQVAGSKIHYIMELCEKVLSATSPEGRDVIKSECDSLKSDFDQFVKSLNQLLLEYNKKIGYTQEFDKVWKQLTTWYDSDLAAKFEEAMNEDTTSGMLNKLRSIDKDIQSRGVLISKVKEYEPIEESVKTFLEDTLYPFMAKLTSTIKESDRELKAEEDYKAAIDDLENYLKDIRIELENIPNGLNSKSLAEVKLKRVLEVKSINLDAKVTTLASMNGNIRRKSNELEPIQFEVGQIKKLIQSNEELLNKSIKAWNDYDATFDNVNKWLLEFEARLKVDAGHLTDLADELNCSGEKLYKSIDSEFIKDHVINNNIHYMTLLNSLNETLVKIEKIKQLKSETNQTAWETGSPIAPVRRRSFRRRASSSGPTGGMNSQGPTGGINSQGGTPFGGSQTLLPSSTSNSPVPTLSNKENINRWLENLTGPTNTKTGDESNG